MAGILASMFAGGVAGGAKAYSDVMDENIKAKREAEKTAVLQVREENLAKLRHGYNLEEGKVSSGLALENQRTLRGEERTYGEETAPSGFMLNGKVLTKKELNLLSPEEKEKLTTIEKKEENLANRKHKERLEEIQEHNKGALSVAEENAKNRFLNKKESGEKIEKFKVLEERALNSLSAKAQAFGGIVDLDNRSITIPTNEKGIPDIEFLKSIDQIGFEFDMSKEPIKKDRKWIGTGDDYFRTIYIGDFKGGKPESEYEVVGDPEELLKNGKTEKITPEEEFNRTVNIVNSQGKGKGNQSGSGLLSKSSPVGSGGEQPQEGRRTPAIDPQLERLKQEGEKGNTREIKFFSDNKAEAEEILRKREEERRRILESGNYPTQLR